MVPIDRKNDQFPHSPLGKGKTFLISGCRLISGRNSVLATQSIRESGYCFRIKAARGNAWTISPSELGLTIRKLFKGTYESIPVIFHVRQGQKPQGFPDDHAGLKFFQADCPDRTAPFHARPAGEVKMDR